MSRNENRGFIVGFASRTSAALKPATAASAEAFCYNKGRARAVKKRHQFGSPRLECRSSVAQPSTLRPQAAFTHRINMKTLHTLPLAIAAAFSIPAFASDFDQVQSLSQAEFANLAKDFTSVASYKSVTPAEPLGVIGFDVGAGVSATRLEHSGIWKKAGYEHSTVYMPRLHVQKGLPFGVDIGASLTAVPDSDIKLIGADIKYAIVPGNVALPALAIRGAATRLVGVDQLDLDTRSVELTASKGFLMFTPYAGVGKVWGSLTPNVGNLKKETPSANKVFAGVNVNLGLVNWVAEVDRTGDNQTVSLKLGFRL